MIKRKLLLIGWDAADWKVINPLMEQGLMPNLEKLVNGGTIGNLETLDPPLSPMLWTSIATGKRAYKHGIIGFGEEAGDGKTVGPITLRNRKVKAVWNILHEQGLRTHVLGWWPGHPAEEVNGIYISNFYQKAPRPIDEPWPYLDGTVYPPHMAARFADMRIHPQEITENHLSLFVPGLREVNQKNDNALQVLTKIIAENATIHAAATYILENESWDFCAVYYDGIDHFNHAFMKYHPPRQPHVKTEFYELYKDCVTAGYRFHDMMLGRLVALAGHDATIMLVSDHGFHPDHLRRKKISLELAGPSQEHSQYGIILAHGEGIKKDDLVYGASLLDVTPTILSLYDLPSAADMDGKVLQTIFTEGHRIQSPVATYENEEQNLSHKTVGPLQVIDAAVLQQLVDLGYIEPQGADPAKNFKRLHEDNDFYLARAYMGGNKYHEAAALLLPLFRLRKSSPRVFAALVGCYCKLGQYDDAVQILEELKLEWQKKYDAHLQEAKEKNMIPDRFRYPVDILYQEAYLCYCRQENDRALSLYNEILPQLTNKALIHLYIGNIYVHKGNISQAKHHFEQELEIDFDNVDAHYGMGICAFRKKDYNAAIEHFLNCVDLRFHYPLAHYHLGECFYKLQQYDHASGAYEVCLQQNPLIEKARVRLIKIYSGYLDNAARLKLHRAYDESTRLPLVYIVSGLPRSGTSLMMKMLAAGGMELFVDNQRQPDESNPTGYYEHKAVLHIARHSEWLQSATDKVVKVVAPLLQFLPMNFRYKVIFMQRNLHEVMHSQSTMLQRSGRQAATTLNVPLMEQYKTLVEECKKWKDKFGNNVEWMEINFEDLHRHPQKVVTEVQTFINRDLDGEKMTSQIDPQLYRSKF